MPKPKPAKSKNYTIPEMADEASVREWSNIMLSGHPSGHATTWEPWCNLFALQFEEVVETMSHLLRIKEDSYNNMFLDKEKAVTEAKVILEKAQNLHDEAEAIQNEHAANVGTIRKQATDIDFLKQKVNVASEKWAKEVEANTNLYSTCKLLQRRLHMGQLTKSGKSANETVC